MNCNFYWQPACFQIMPDVPTNVFIDQSALNFHNNASPELAYQELKKKCLELELENSRLKQQLNLLQQSKLKKIKRIVKRRKQQDLEKKFRCSHPNCKKQYASTLALNLHIKTKHNMQIKDGTSDRKDQVSFQRFIVKQQGENGNSVESKTLFKFF